MLTVGSLFSGIGGFDLGLERAGMRVIWQSEIDPYASAILRKYWPGVPNLGDICGITAATLADAERAEWWKKSAWWHEQYRNDAGRVEASDRIGACRKTLPDVLCGGFPCQDISNAGKRAGIDGERSGLWSEFARLIGELRPRYAIMENVAALLGRGIERVLGDLAALGYDAEWHCIPASAVGAPHRRDRVWIVAYCEQSGLEGLAGNVANGYEPGWFDAAAIGSACESDLRSRRLAGWWLTEPDVGRVAHGVSRRVDRLRCLGNAIVPQVAEIIGRAIVAAHVDAVEKSDASPKETNTSRDSNNFLITQDFS